jgi:hypothetical protein
MKVPVWLWIVPAFMALIAVAPLPYDYYTLLRIVVSGAAAFIAWREFQATTGRAWFWVFVASAIGFNPFIPIHLSREMWFYIDLAIAGVFLAYGLLTFSRRDDSRE